MTAETEQSGRDVPTWAHGVQLLTLLWALYALAGSADALVPLVAVAVVTVGKLLYSFGYF